MKYGLKICIVAMFFLLGSQSASAGLLVWWEATIITFAPPPNNIHVARGATPYECEVDLERIAMSVDRIRSQTLCIRMVDWGYVENLRRDIFWPKGPWPPGPGPGPYCLSGISGISCPILDDATIDKIYPEFADRVKYLKEIYQIDEYNKELLNLQGKYKLEGFEKSMFEIELQQKLNGVKR